MNPEKSTSPFVHLHCHTDFSLLDGAANIGRLIARVKELGMQSVAITDHGNLFGALRFWKECLSQGIKPIIGCELYMAPQGRLHRKKIEGEENYHHLVLLAKNDQGYRHLCLLSSIGYTEGFYYKPRIDWEVLSRYHEGLICLSACLAGEIPQLILAGKLQEAEKRAKEYHDLFGEGNYYLELQNHGLEEQQRVNQFLIELSSKLNIPLVATNDSHYVQHDDADAHDTLLCIGTGKKKNDTKRLRFDNSEFYLKSHDQMQGLFPGLNEALANTVRIAQDCCMEMRLPGPLLPEFQVPQDFLQRSDKLLQDDLNRLASFFMVSQPFDSPKTAKNENLNLTRLEQPATRYFVWQANSGLRRRYGQVSQRLIDRLDYELSVIIHMDFVGYFLIVADFINWAKDHNIPVGPARGSGAGSIVAYCLRITEIDPLRYKLLFERFLNPERISMPDFDIDFCMNRRQDVVDYVTSRYGEDKVAQIITFGTLKPKAALKDVARVLDINFKEANELSSLVPDDSKISLKKLLSESGDYVEKEWQENSLKIKAYMEKGRLYQNLFDTAIKLEGLSRHCSTHAAGLVISKTKLTDYVPLYKDPKTGVVMTQFTMDFLEECGLVKMDFLGLATLTLIRETLDLIQKKGITLQEENIPQNDEKTFKMLSEGHSSCVFQFESSGMQKVLTQAKPTCIEDLIALNALYRPGPMEQIPHFIKGKQYPHLIEWLHPDLKETLKETYGVIVYQEQVMEVAQIIAGYSLGNADLLRRAMSKKKGEEMGQQEDQFLAGAEKKGYAKEVAKRIFDYLVPFAGYGFNKSHAAAYSLIAYKTAYLKANYPAEFMAANLTNEMDNQEKMTKYMAEARAMGIEILPPHVNTSDRFFTALDGKIVFGLQGVKTLGAAVAEEILRARAQGGFFHSFIDFLNRVDLRLISRRVFETGIQCGLFDRLGHNRATLFHHLEKLITWTQRQKEEKTSRQGSFFDQLFEKSLPEVEIIPEKEWEPKLLLSYEKQSLGMFVSGHPLDSYREIWESSSTVNLAKPCKTSEDKDDQVVGIVNGIKVIVTKKGDKMAWASLEDFQGSIELIFFPRTLQEVEFHLIEEAILRVKGRLQISDGKPKFVVKEVFATQEGFTTTPYTVHVKIKQQNYTEADVRKIHTWFLGLKGNSPLVFHLSDGKKEVKFRSSSLLAPSSSQAFQAIQSQRWVETVWRE